MNIIINLKMSNPYPSEVKATLKKELGNLVASKEFMMLGNIGLDGFKLDAELLTTKRYNELLEKEKIYDKLKKGI